MSLTGDPDGPPYRAGISVFDVMAGNHAAIGILAALRHRDAHRRGPARRGQPAVLRADRAGQPQLRLRGRRRRAVPDGQRAPERVPVRAAAHRGRRPDRHRRQRRPVPQALRGARHPRDRRRPAVRPQRRPHRAPRGAAPAARRAAGASAARSSGSSCWSRPGCPCGPINTIDGGFAMAERFGLDPVVEVGEGDRAVPTTRHPIRFSETPADYRLPPPELDEHGRRDPGLAGGATREREAGSMSRARVPDRARRLVRRHDHPARPRPGRGRDGQGRVRRARVLAGHPAAADARRDPGVRGGARRAGRPRLHPDRHRHPADLPVRPGLRAGRAGRRAARRRVPLPGRHRGLRPASCTTCSPRSTTAARRRRRLGRPRPADRTSAAARRGGSCPASATTCTRTATPARRG